jgi:hypothetical protein
MAQNHSLFVQSKRRLPYFSTFQHHSLLRPFSTIFQVLSSDLSTFLREPTCKEFFSYAELMGDMAEWKWTGPSLKDDLKGRSNRGKIPFRC